MTQRDATEIGKSPANARQLLDFINGNWTTQAIYVAARLGIPDVLAEKARSTEELAFATGAHVHSLQRLMRALVTIGICREIAEDSSYELTAMGSLLRADTEDSLRSWALYWGGAMWPIWGNLLHSVNSGESARKLVTGEEGFDRLESDPEAAANFNRAMVELTRLDAASIVRACELSGMSSVVDVGGGYGELLAAILLANPTLRGVLFDRPHAMVYGQQKMATAMLEKRCEFVVGDFFESIPSGVDAYVLKSVIHDWNDERSKVILRNCHRAMHPDARLLLIERIVPNRLEASAAHRAIARSDLNMLVGLGSQERTESEFRALLHATDFHVVSVASAGPTFSIIEAKRSP
jgi:orsellinic acid C2-O-methyltransferase